MAQRQRGVCRIGAGMGGGISSDPGGEAGSVTRPVDYFRYVLLSFA
jgi:hypothetical protein